jgi:hypothetical protein
MVTSAVRTIASGSVTPASMGPAGHSRSTRPATAGTTSEGGESTPTDAKIVVGRAMKYLAGAVLTRG